MRSAVYRVLGGALLAATQQLRMVATFASSSADDSYLCLVIDLVPCHSPLRLYTNGDFIARLQQQFEGDYKLHFHMAPPILSKPGKPGGEPRKIEIGSWMFGALKFLAKMKGLRGGLLDPFGKTAERRMERRLIEEFQTLISGVLPRLSVEYQVLIEKIASLPDLVKGYGPIKERNVEQYEAEKKRLVTELETAAAPVARVIKVVSA